MYGDYGLNPSGGGKYFALTDQEAINFAHSSINRGLKMSITSMEIPTGWLPQASHVEVDRGIVNRYTLPMKFCLTSTNP